MGLSFNNPTSSFEQVNSPHEEANFSLIDWKSIAPELSDFAAHPFWCVWAFQISDQGN